MLSILRRSILVVLFASPYVYGQTGPRPSEADTAGIGPSTAASSARTFTLGEVVVTGTRMESLLRSIPSPVSFVTRSELSERPGRLVADGLSAIAGLTLKSYGGGAAVQNVSLRGMSAEHTLVLIDGQRFNSYQNGVADLGILSSLGVERIEIARGGGSALYGPDAVGGVINLITEKPSDQLRIGAQTSIGSAGYSSLEISGSGITEPVAVAAAVRRERGRGDYEYDFSDGKTSTRVRRAGDDFQILSANMRASADITENIRSTLFLLLSDADRGSPGPVTDRQTSSRARLYDQSARLQTGITWDISEGLQGRLASSWQYAYERFVDPGTLVGGHRLDSYYHNHSFLLSPEFRYIASPGVTALAGMELGRGSLSSNDLHDSKRWQQSYFLTSQFSLPLQTPVTYEVIIYPSFRFDNLTDVGSAASPKLGVNIGVLRLPDLRLRASYGKSFRAPSFNDLYWIVGGNPDLKPERSVCFDGGVICTIPLHGTLTFAATYFDLITRDRILWVPISGGIWSPRNISRVTSAGLEAELQWKGLNDVLELAFNTTLMRARKESEDFPGDPTAGKDLIYIPRQTFNATAAVRIDDLSVFFQYAWTSFRYTTEYNDRFLPHFSLASAAVRYAVSIDGVRTNVKIEMTNLFNSSYQSIALFPMPLRGVRGTVGVDL